MSTQTTLTRKGQVTIPVHIRRALELKEGDQLAVIRQGETVLLRRVTSVAERTAGILSDYRLTTPLTPEQERMAFEDAVADEVTGEASR